MSFVAPFAILASLVASTTEQLNDALRRQDTNATFSLVARVSTAYPEYSYLSVEDTQGAVTLAWKVGNRLRSQLPAIAPGDTIRVTGYVRSPLYINGVAFCQSAEVLSHGPAPTPRPITLRAFNGGACEARLVQVRGHVTDAFRDECDPVWIYLVLTDEGDSAYAAFRSETSEPIDFKQWIGCDVTLTCLAHPDEGGARHHVGRMLIASDARAITVISRPRWWTAAKFATIIGILFGLLVAALIWVRSLRTLAERRSRELLREKIAHAAAELRVAERTRLAADLHDSVSQNLTGASMQLNTALRLEKSDPVGMHQQLVCAVRTIRACRDELHNCLTDLRSKALDATDMNEAIRLTLQPQRFPAHISVRFNVPRSRLLDQTAHAVLQIIRELVSNAILHGHAQNIRIAGSIQEHHLLFSVRDDGIGFDPTTAPGPQQGHFGLQGIRERILRHNGTLEITSLHPSGTKVMVTMK